ncbi:MAG: hypothetical protein MUE52_04855 [Tabrizicola sp.]|jgi:Ca2+-binding EF-hand superfamily protein|nr:hypothetical protein [Tabrizicola sp.]
MGTNVVYGYKHGAEARGLQEDLEFEIRSRIRDALETGRSSGKLDGDGKLTAAELESFLDDLLGKDVTRRQVEQLTQIYGVGGTVSEDTVINTMTSDGFLQEAYGGGWLLIWDNINGDRIADALFRKAGLNSRLDTMTEHEFVAASKGFFGDREGLSEENANFLTRTFGTANRLSRDELANIYDTRAVHLAGFPKEDYTRVFVNMKSDSSPFQDTAQAANYIMSYDGNNDGMINGNEFKAALHWRHGNDIHVRDELIDQYMAYYGFNDGGGQRVLNREGVTEMLSEGALYLTGRGHNGAQGFGINLNITSSDRIIRGMADMDPQSRGDGVISKTELVNLMKQFGLDLTGKQTDALMQIYGNGTYMNLADVQRMRNDGFFTPGTVLAQGAALVWDNIDGKLLAAAVFREVGVNPSDRNARVTSDQFHDGVKKLFGDLKGHSLQAAVAQNRAVGLNGTLSVEEMGQIFDSPSMHIDGVRGENYIRVLSNVKEHLPVTDASRMLRYVLSFNASGDGILKPHELETALESWGGKGANLDKGMVERLSRLYSFDSADGKGGLSIADLEQLISDKVLVAGGDKGAGFRVNLEAVPLDRLVDRMFLLAGKNPETDKLTARDFHEGTAHILGDWKPLRADGAKRLAAAYGDSEGNLARGQVYDIFASGAVQFGHVGDRSFMPITVNLEIAENFAKQRADSVLRNPGRELLGAHQDPSVTFKDKPDLFGNYYVKNKYNDGTTITMEYSGTSAYSKYNRYNVEGVTIELKSEGFTGVVTAKGPDKDGKWSVVSQHPNIDYAYGKVRTVDGKEIPLLTLRTTDGKERHFLLHENKATEYHKNTPVGRWAVSDRYETPDDPKDDLDVSSVTELGSTRKPTFLGTLDFLAFEVQLSDGSKKTVYVEKAEGRTAEWVRESAELFGTQYGKLNPQLRDLLKETPTFVVADRTGEYETAKQGVDGNNNLFVFERGLLGKEFQNTLVHELGHLVDYDIPAPYWRTAMNADGRAPSNYAKTDTQEDFSETFQLWFLVRTGGISGKAADKFESQFSHRFYLLDRSQSAVSTLPEGLRTNPADGLTFKTDSTRKMYDPSLFDRIFG